MVGLAHMCRSGLGWTEQETSCTLDGAASMSWLLVFGGRGGRVCV